MLSIPEPSTGLPISYQGVPRCGHSVVMAGSSNSLMMDEDIGSTVDANRGRKRGCRALHFNFKDVTWVKWQSREIYTPWQNATYTCPVFAILWGRQKRHGPISGAVFFPQPFQYPSFRTKIPDLKRKFWFPDLFLISQPRGNFIAKCYLSIFSFEKCWNFNGNT
jgi:hypothetical protein